MSEKYDVLCQSFGPSCTYIVLVQFVKYQGSVKTHVIPNAKHDENGARQEGVREKVREPVRVASYLKPA